MDPPLHVALGRASDILTDESTHVSTTLSSVSGSVFSGGKSIEAAAVTFCIEHDFKTNTLPSTRIYGREPEIEILRSAFSQLQATGERAEISGNIQHQGNGINKIGSKRSYTSEVVVLHGPSGSGKTKLVDAALRNYVTSNNGSFISGKFDQGQMIGESFSALSTALSDLCELLLSSLTEEEIATLRSSVRHVLGNEARVLTGLIPNLSYLLPEIKVHLGSETEGPSSETEGPSSVPGGGKAAFTRLQQLCCSFLRVVATADKPVALFVDDVQWADEASLQIIRTLATHPETKHVLVVVAFRDDDLSASSKSMKKHHQNAQEFVAAVQKEEVDELVAVNCIEIEVGDLDGDSLNEMVSALLGANEEETRDLSELILLKTHGNPFFVEQYLDILQQKGLLKRSSDGDQSFCWDVAEIRSETDVSSNVAELVSKRIMLLAEPVQEVLKLAAMLGHRFHYNMLRTVVEGVLPRSLTTDQSEVGDCSLSLPSILQSAVETGLLEAGLLFKFKFSHDRIQQCLLGMVDNEEVNLLHLRIGRALRNLSSKHARKQKQKGSSSRLSVDESSALWLATDHLNLGSSEMSEMSEKLDLVQLNVQAGKHSLQQCDFRPSANYIEKALSLLEEVSDQKWKDHYESTLEVASLLSYLHYCLGDEMKCNLHSRDVIDNAKCLYDKMDAYCNKVLSDCSHEDALVRGCQLGLSVLDMLGEGLPYKVRFWHIGRELMAARKGMRKIDHEAILHFPPMVDKNKLAAVKILQCLMFSVYHSEHHRSHFALMVLRLMNLTLQYGTTVWTPAIIAQYGGLEAVIGNLKVGRQLLTLSTKLIEESTSKKAQSRALAMQHGLLSQWFQGYPEAIEGFKQSHRLGMESGEFEFALHSASQYVSLAMFSTVHLTEIEQDTRVICQQMKEFNMQNMLIVALPMWQGMLNMMGEADGDPAKLTGEAMDEDEFVAKVEGGANTLAALVLTMIRLGTAAAFNRWVVVEELLPKLLKDKKKILNGHFSDFYATFLECVITLRLYGRNGLRKHRRRGRMAVKKLETWSRMGVVDCDATALAMRADLMMVTDRKHGRQSQIALELFHESMVSAQKLGMLQLEAYFNERLFELLSRAHQDRDQARPYLERAMEMYDSWGAYGKVDFLKRAHY